MYAEQKEIPNIELTCYTEDRYRMIITFDTLTQCKVNLSDTNTTLSFTTPVIDLDTYFPLIKGLTRKEGNRWIRFEAKIDNSYRLTNGADIAHSYNIYNFKHLSIIHSTRTDGEERDYYFELS